MKRILTTLTVITLLVGCSQKPVKTDAPAPTEAAPADASAAPDPNAAPAPSAERVLASYSLLQLDAAANAYKITSDESIGKPGDMPPPNLFGCPISGNVARRAILPIRALIDSKIMREQSSYVHTPAIYLRTREAATCEKTCSCGVLLDVLAGIDVRVLRKSEQTHHEDLLSQLQAKSARQGPDASLECAKKQNWICGSDLDRYVNAHLTDETPKQDGAK